jgi:hypothetical protein
MTLRKAALIFFSIAVIPATLVAYFVHRDLVHAEEFGHDFGASGEGVERTRTLVGFTRDYVSHHADAPPAMRKGSELAPTDFLNEKLTEKGEKWRVRDVHGLAADTYDVI